MSKRVVLAGSLVIALGFLLWIGSGELVIEQVFEPEQTAVELSASQTVEPESASDNPSAGDAQGLTQAPQAHEVDESRVEQVPTPAALQTEEISVVRSQTSTPEQRSLPVENVPKLSPQVFAAIEDVQQMQLEGRWEESLDLLNAQYADYDALSNFEQTTLLNFYTNTLLRFEMWPEAIGAFSRMLLIPDLRADIGARALMALGQLHARVGEYAASVSYLESWQQMTSDMDNMERSRQRVAELLVEYRAALQ